MTDFELDEPVDDSDLDRDYHPEEASTSTTEGESNEGDTDNNQSTRSRKRIRNESSWARNKAKNARNGGGEFIGHRKLLKPAKAVQNLADHQCRYECKSFSNEDRQQIFDDYWNLESWNLQTAFLTACMETHAPKKVTVEPRNTKYLSGELSIHKMYTLYLQYCRDNNIQNPVKESFYRYIFTTKFNLRFKRPYTDTCTICDTLENKISNDINPEVVNDSKVQKEIHLRKAEKARINPNTVNAICFDLEKTLPTRGLTCSKVYYLRQLWTYNFAVNNLANDQASMFMWHEGEAFRGSQEIGSCLLKYVQQLPNSIEHIIAFSDNAGDQNKNHNIIKFWRHIVQTTSVCTVDHKFLVSAHSYMECDQDFGLIEKSKKKNQYIFVPDDWNKVVPLASRKFTVVYE
ncbi:uncharacterized protein LOC126734626 [Anthonomus grandis grandis]|uniref:uncharacterized protein LOC126734626 n=1 Tax=Anthonomus grandis grandis TaxID=2921223 RepID=UPI00216625E5|nr:uncharacterized protein LOC126734626 [Anthonomus grandis grandis]